MANRIISDKELELVLAICEGLTDENTLAKKLNMSSQQISSMIQVLISATPGCATGLVMADMRRLGGSTVEHAHNIRLSPLGKTACELQSTVVPCQ